MVCDWDQPGILEAFNVVVKQLAVVAGGDRVAGENAIAGVESLLGLPAAGRGSEDVWDFEVGAVRKFGEGVTELLKDGDARIMFVVIGPQVAAKILAVTETTTHKLVVVRGGIGGNRSRNGFWSFHS